MGPQNLRLREHHGRDQHFLLASTDTPFRLCVSQCDFQFSAVRSLDSRAQALVLSQVALQKLGIVLIGRPTLVPFQAGAALFEHICHFFLENWRGLGHVGLSHGGEFN